MPSQIKKPLFSLYIVCMEFFIYIFYNPLYIYLVYWHDTPLMTPHAFYNAPSFFRSILWMHITSPTMQFLNCISLWFAASYNEKMILWFTSQAWPPRMSLLAGCAPLPVPLRLLVSTLPARFRQPNAPQRFLSTMTSSLCMVSSWVYPHGNLCTWLLTGLPSWFVSTVYLSMRSYGFYLCVLRSFS